MKILLSVISARRPTSGPTTELLALYLDRAARYLPTSTRTFATEAALLSFVTDATTRTRPALILTDSRGQQLTSEDREVVSSGCGQRCTKGLDAESETTRLVQTPERRVCRCNHKDGTAQCSIRMAYIAPIR